MSAPILNLVGFRRLPLLRQVEVAECGLACIAMVAAYHGHDADLASLRHRFAISLKGASLKSVIEIASSVGLGSRAVRCELDELSELSLPAILHWDLNHFVVLKEVKRNTVVLHDPAFGVQVLTKQEVSKRFSGVALELTPAQGFQRKRERTVLRLGALVKLTPDTFRSLVQALILSLIIELFVLATPFYMQLMIDEVVQSSDASFALVLASAFLSILLFQVIATALRGLVIQFVGNVLSYEAESRLFHHMLRLPLDWFHKRQTGDIQSRFGAVEPVKQFIAGDAITVVFDSVFGVLTVLMMFLYSSTLGAIVLASVALYTLLRFATVALQKRVAGDYILADAKEQTRFLETLRAAQTIKVAGAENQREALQRNSIAATLNAGIRSGNVNIGYAAAQQSIEGVTSIMAIYLGAMAVLRGEMTIGMLTAFLAYKGQFVSRASSLIEGLVSWSLLDVHLERIADIALYPREVRFEHSGFEGEIEGSIDVRNLMYTYALGEPEVLKHLNFTITPGEFVAITGPSGCGKSTLLKLLTGLYKPSFGEVLIDGRPLSSWNPRVIRQQIGVVMQDDVLLQGSIADNIAFFDERIDMDRVVEVATQAAIHSEIMRMPMGYRTLVGDMGSTLSGGQKQRVMIARALYRRPRIVFFDEGTSHLDALTEQSVTAAMKELKITRVIVAHRRETIMAADREICIAGRQEGRLQYRAAQPEDLANSI